MLRHRSFRHRPAITSDPKRFTPDQFVRQYGYLPEQKLREVLAAHDGFRCSEERVEELLASRFRPLWSPDWLGRFLWHLLQPADLRRCWDWDAASTLSDGVPVLNIGRPVSVKRLSFFLYVNRWIPEGMLVVALCDSRRCANPTHVALGDHALAAPRGEDQVGARLTEEQVRELRAAHARGISYGRLARKLGVHTSTVRDAVMGRRWSHVA